MRKILKILSITILVAISFLALKNHNFDGYCEEVERILTDEELIKKAAGKIYEENPYCCEVADSYTFSDVKNDFLNRLLAGRYIKGLTVYSKRDTPLKHDINYPYYLNYIAVNQCGRNIDSAGMSIDIKEYNSRIDRIKKLKEEK